MCWLVEMEYGKGGAKIKITSLQVSVHMTPQSFMNKKYIKHKERQQESNRFA